MNFEQTIENETLPIALALYLEQPEDFAMRGCGDCLLGWRAEMESSAGLLCLTVIPREDDVLVDVNGNDGLWVHYLMPKSVH